MSERWRGWSSMLALVIGLVAGLFAWVVLRLSINAALAVFVIAALISIAIGRIAETIWLRRE